MARHLPAAVQDEINLWNAETGVHKHTIAGHMESVENVAFSPDGRTIASGRSIRNPSLGCGNECTQTYSHGISGT